MFCPPPCSYPQNSFGLFELKVKDEFYVPFKWLYAEDGSRDEYPVVVFCHGNACDLGDAEKQMQVFRYHSNIVLLEYPGYGPTGELFTPNEKNVSETIESLLDHLVLELGIPLDNLILMGQSIGTGVVSHGARYLKEQHGRWPAGLVLISPYKSIKTLACDIVPSSGCSVLERFNTMENLKGFNECFVIVHGCKDEVIPVNHGRDISQMLKQTAKFHYVSFPENGTHNSLVYQGLVDLLILTLKKLMRKVKIKETSKRWSSESLRQKRRRSSVIALSTATCAETSTARCTLI